jgi:hypothetical protein
VLNGVEPGAVYGSGNRYNTYYRKVEPQTDEDDEFEGGGNSARVNGNGAGPHAPSPVPRWRRGVARFSRP